MAADLEIYVRIICSYVSLRFHTRKCGPVGLLYIKGPPHWGPLRSDLVGRLLSHWPTFWRDIATLLTVVWASPESIWDSSSHVWNNDCSKIHDSLQISEHVAILIFMMVRNKNQFLMFSVYFKLGSIVSWRWLRAVGGMFSSAFIRKTCRCHFSLLLFIQPVQPP